MSKIIIFDEPVVLDLTKVNINDVTEHEYESGHIEYRLWNNSAGYIILTEDEYNFILYRPDLEE